MKMTQNKINILKALMEAPKNSDREVSLKAHVSQPTVSRTRAAFEADGIIKGYAVIPDLAKLGYEMLAITEIRDQNPTFDIGRLQKDPRVIFAMHNINSIVVLSRHKNYSDFSKFSSQFETVQSFQTTTEKGIIKDLAIREL